MFCYFWGKGNGWFHGASIDFKVSSSFSLLYNIPDLIFKPRGLQMQIALLVSELEAQKRSQLFTVFWGETVQLWGAQQHCLRQSHAPFSPTYHPFCGIFSPALISCQYSSTTLHYFFVSTPFTAFRSESRTTSSDFWSFLQEIALAIFLHFFSLLFLLLAPFSPLPCTFPQCYPSVGPSVSKLGGF